MKLKGTQFRSVLRALLYSASIFFIFYVLSIQKFYFSRELYLFFAFLGAVLLLEESFFTVYYTSLFTKKLTNYLNHAINHLVYPQVFYIGYVLYANLHESYFMSFSLAVLSGIAYFFYFYLLPAHLHDNHIDSDQHDRTSARVDFVHYIFKFLSYFVFNLALFELFKQSFIDLKGVFVVNTLINSVYLIAHLNRKYEVSRINTMIAIAFSIITALFVINLRVPSVDYSASIATLVFYLASGIFYHKLDGTFSYKILIEYCSIALILSIFLFHV